MAGQIARTASALVASALFVVLLPACSTSVRDADVVLSSVRAASVIDSNGAARAAQDGDRLNRGDRVTTASAGTATLAVRGRLVVLAERSQVRVPDGASVEVVRGTVLVDRRRGPGLTVVAGDSSIDRIGVGAMRVERSFAVAVALYSGSARIRTRSGRSLDVRALHQASVAGRALPAAPQPLALRHDTWERAVIPSVLASDESLTRIARGIDTGSRASALPSVVPAAYRNPGGQPSETLLPVAIGRAAAARRGSEAEQVARARALRRDGGSWGVVAALASTTAPDIGVALAALLDLAASIGNGGSATGPTSPASPSPQPGATTAPPGPGPGPTGSPGPDPTTSPSPTPSPTEDPVAGVIDTVRGLLPSPSPLRDLTGLLLGR